jgi:quercetin dioxygenase-like cupin family protein
MSNSAQLVDAGETIDVLGPTIEYLTPLDGDENGPCVMRGTIPPGGVVPLHAHADPETFLMISGHVEGLVHSDEGFTWVRIGPGDVFHIPGNAKHAWRNQSDDPAVMHLVSTTRIGRFFREVGRPAGAAAGPPSPEALEHFLETAERYGYWNATPEENAAIGLALDNVR